MLIWYIFSGFGITHQEKSGNPVPEANDATQHTKNGKKLQKKLWKKRAV
jgi:hypothetical protein